LENIFFSRRDIHIEELYTVYTATGAILEADVRSHDDSRLVVVEELEEIVQRQVRRVSFVFHYQQANGSLIFRYDSSPHYPQISTFPSHKHTPYDVVAADPPDLTEVPNEINSVLYPRTNSV
jgi:hypothetical protein